jgi:hypothetical protein
MMARTASARVRRVVGLLCVATVVVGFGSPVRAEDIRRNSGRPKASAGSSGQPEAWEHGDGKSASAVKEVLGIATQCGLYLVAESGRSLFLLPGSNFSVVPSVQSSFYRVDETLFRSAIVTAAEINAPPDENAGIALLRRHRKWELDWIAHQHGAKIASASEPADGESAGRPFFVWSYQFSSPPTIAGDVIRGTTYLTMELPDERVFVLAALQTTRDTSQRVDDLLRKVARTAFIFDSDAEFATIVRQIRQSARRAKTCKEFSEILRTSQNN